MSDTKKKIVAISGSTRKNSSNERILRVIADLYQEELAVEIYNQLDILPYFNPYLEKESLPVGVINFRNLIEAADGVIICTPEYVFSLPGALKNALEWTVSTTVFSYKPVAFIVAAASGEKAFESLDLILITLVQKEVKASSKLLIQGGKSKINEAGKFTDEKVLDNIKTIVDSLIINIEESNLTANNI